MSLFVSWCNRSLCLGERAFIKTLYSLLETQSLMLSWCVFVHLHSCSIKCLVSSWMLPSYSSKPSMKKQNRLFLNIASWLINWEKARVIWLASREMMGRLLIEDCFSLDQSCGNTSGIKSGMALSVACSNERLKPCNDFCSSLPGFQKKKFEKTTALPSFDISVYIPVNECSEFLACPVP